MRTWRRDERRKELENKQKKLEAREDSKGTRGMKRDEQGYKHNQIKEEERKRINLYYFITSISIFIMFLLTFSLLSFSICL